MVPPALEMPALMAWVPASVAVKRYSRSVPLPLLADPWKQLVAPVYRSPFYAALPMV